MAESAGDIEPAILVAIVAAADASWPRQVVVADAEADAPPRWRFSGRWWSRPVPTRRLRPW